MIAYRAVQRRIQTGRPQHTALVKPDTGEELGRFYVDEKDGCYRVLMPDAFGECNILLPDLFVSMHAAKKAILDAHIPEDE